MIENERRPLYARFQWNPWAEPTIVIYAGDVPLDTVKPTDYGVKLSNAGSGDDSAYFDDEDRRIVDETFAAWIRERLMNS